MAALGVLPVHQTPTGRAEVHRAGMGPEEAELALDGTEAPTTLAAFHALFRGHGCLHAEPFGNLMIVPSAARVTSTTSTLILSPFQT